MPPIKPLLVSLKDKVAQDLGDQDLSNAFRQIELWSQTVTELGLPGVPPPTNSPNTLSYTDPSGQLWVAKGGVHGGQYRLARDVLHARIYRNAAFPVQTIGVTLLWDTVVNDPYGMLPGGSAAGFLIPATGIYRVMFQVAATPTATGQWMVIQIGGSSTALSSVHAASTAMGVYCRAEDTRLVNAGNSFSVTILASANINGIPGGGTTYASIDYLGSG